MRQRAALLLGTCLFAGTPAGAQGVETVRIATGLAKPVFLTAPPGDLDRVFVVEQHLGRIRILRTATRALVATPFLTVPGVSQAPEQGLLGLAFHPDYATNGTFYVSYTNPNTQVVRYQVSADPDVADPTSAAPILSIVQPSGNHNGGWIAFGPDRLLYIAMGDGGSANDDGPGHTPLIGNAQDITDNLLGKILRIDVDGDDFSADPLRNYAIPSDNPFVGVTGDDEIWVYGLRNPWRPSFDRWTGDLYIADVGQGSCEELDVQPIASTGGENYGWRLREGMIATPTGGVGGPPPPGAVDPIFDYPHSPGSEPCSGPAAGFSGFAITGGYVYRRPLGDLDGRYFFADYFRGALWSLRYDGSPPSAFDGTNSFDLTDHTGDPAFTPDVGSFNSISSFGEDALGNLYVLDLDGDVFFIPEPPGTPMLLVGVAATWALGRRRMARAGGRERVSANEGLAGHRQPLGRSVGGGTRIRT